MTFLPSWSSLLFDVFEQVDLLFSAVCLACRDAGA